MEELVVLVWIIVFFAIIAVCLDTMAGKVVFGAAVVALGLLLLSWITGFGFLIAIAKGCAIVMVVVVVGAILVAIIG